MRASRLLSIVLLLQSRGPLTAQQLADELEVSIRTVYRDVDSLWAAGVPVQGERGAGGGYRLPGGYRTKLTGLTAAEAESLPLAGLPGPAAELGLGSVLAASQLKLLAAMPPELRSRAAAVQQRFHLDAPGWFRQGDRPAHLATVAGAVWDERRLAIRYRRWEGLSERVVDPLGLVLKGGAWYLMARREGELRTYRVSRILAAEVLDESFARPEGFDLAAEWTDRSAQFEAGVHREEATVRISPTGMRWLGVTFDPAAARTARERAGEPDDDGWVTTAVPFGVLEKARAEFLHLGADVEVLGPPELREAIAASVRALATRYAV